MSGGSLSGGLCLGGLCPGGSLSGVVSVRETHPSPGERPSCMVTSGRYASYWNAFLFGIIFAEICMKMDTI